MFQLILNMSKLCQNLNCQSLCWITVSEFKLDLNTLKSGSEDVQIGADGL